MGHDFHQVNAATIARELEELEASWTAMFNIASLRGKQRDEARAEVERITRSHDFLSAVMARYENEWGLEGNWDAGLSALRSSLAHTVQECKRLEAEVERLKGSRGPKKCGCGACVHDGGELLPWCWRAKNGDLLGQLKEGTHCPTCMSFLGPWCGVKLEAKP